jgi:prepilin-type N-terminal cleavage/methylation domain-containing protein
VNHRKTGFTIVELLTVVAIIATLVAVLVPALNTVRRIAKEAKQKAQLATIELALETFKNDYGDYPPSSWWAPPPAPTGPQDYCGAQKLTEALVGWDLRGFHPDSDFRADGHNDGGVYIYDPDNAVFLEQRKDPYLELATANVFRLGTSGAGRLDGLFDFSGAGCPLEEDTFVICDVFGVKPVLTAGMSRPVKAGAPILYYKANTSSKNIDDVVYENRIYNFRDNYPIVALRRLADWNKPFSNRMVHRLENVTQFYEYIRDPKVPGDRAWPYRPNSYILISAGADGLYGTNDDIRNFGN